MVTVSILLGLLVVLNLIVMIAVFRDQGLTVLQKTAQTFLIWILPFIGALIVLVFLAQNHTRAEMRSLVPPPFHMVGYQRREREYHEPPEASCG